MVSGTDDDQNAGDIVDVGCGIILRVDDPRRADHGYALAGRRVSQGDLAGRSRCSMSRLYDAFPCDFATHPGSLRETTTVVSPPPLPHNDFSRRRRSALAPSAPGLDSYP